MEGWMAMHKRWQDVECIRNLIKDGAIDEGTVAGQMDEWKNIGWIDR